MLLGRQLFLSIILLFLSASAHADENYKHAYLTPPEIERVRAFKELLYGVDKKSLGETIDELERTRHPQINLLMREAMARTYADIVREINVEDQKKKEWLYSMVCLNMAYLQFGGDQGNSRNTTSLNRLIRRKLISYLPSNASKQQGFIYSLE